MPTGHFIRTEEHKRNIGLAHKGKKRKPFSLECRKKMSKAHKGLDYSYLHTPEVRLKRRIALTGRKGKSLSKTHKLILKNRMMGKNNPNWGGGTTNRKELIRGHNFYKQWRQEVFTRDNFTCQICKVKGGYLEVDHIKTLYEIIKDFLQIKDREEFIEKVWSIPIMKDISNGRTLCKPCHKKTDTWGVKYRWKIIRGL